MRIFLSYSRDASELAIAVMQCLNKMGHHVWCDRALTGGQTWWNEILKEIRNCDVFAIILSREYQRSVPCRQELHYATSIPKQVLPILCEDGLSLKMLPSHISEIQYVDYRKQDMESVFALVAAFNQLPPPFPPPAEFPPEPPIPLSYLANLYSKVENTDALAPQDASFVFVEAAHGLEHIPITWNRCL